MEVIKLGAHREVHVFGKNDGNGYDPEHEAHHTFISARQVHGNWILVVPEDHTETGKHHSEADALFTIHDRPIGVYVADCLPLVLVGEHCNAVVHCSWRTLHGWLLQDVLALFHKNHDHILHAYLWPCIKHYEVGEEFEQYFPDKFLIPNGDKYYFDIPWYTKSILDAWGLHHDAVIIDPWCTREHSDKYWSYRKGARDMGNFVGVKRV